MILCFFPENTPKFERWGIGNGIKDSRAITCFSLLNKEEKFKIYSSSLLRPHLKIEDFLAIHSQHFLNRLKQKETLPIEISLAFECPAPSVEICEQILSSTLKQIADLEISYRVSVESKQSCFLLGGGMHHAAKEGGKGFCLLNDVAYVCDKILQENSSANILIIDVDAHQGDGTVEIFQENPRVTILDLYMKGQWPNCSPFSLHKATCDFPLENGNGDSYLEQLKLGLITIGHHLQHQKVDACFVRLVADPFEKDELKSSSFLQLSLEEMGQRDEMIWQYLQENQQGVPTVFMMAGGYGPYAYLPPLEFLKTRKTKEGISLLEL